MTKTSTERLKVHSLNYLGELIDEKCLSENIFGHSQANEDIILKHCKQRIYVEEQLKLSFSGMSKFGYTKRKRGLGRCGLPSNRNTWFSDFSGNSSESGFSSFLECLYQIFHWFQSLQTFIVETYQKIFKGVKKKEKEEHAEVKTIDFSQEDPQVTARGVGLMAAYTGRRAVFAVYPASREARVTSEGPAPLHFEYRLREGLLLVGYVPPLAGRYLLTVTRRGLPAPGSPFQLRVDDPPPGYTGHFGASLWDPPPHPAPLTTGIVDFVTEKMFLTEDGRLLKIIHDNQPISQLFPIISEDKMKKLTKEDKNDLNMKSVKNESSSSKTEEKLEVSIQCRARTELMKRIDDMLSVIAKGNQRKIPRSKYRVSKALFKELHLSLKILSLISIGEESQVYNIKKPNQRPKPILTISDETVSIKRSNQNRDNQSKVDQFLSRGELRYPVRRTEKLERDDCVSNEPCDVRGQIGTGSDPRASGFNGTNRNGSRQVWAKYDCFGFTSNMKKSFNLNLPKSKTEEVTGVQLLQKIYKGNSIGVVENNEQSEINLTLYKQLNNETSQNNYIRRPIDRKTRSEYHKIHNIHRHRRIDKKQIANFKVNKNTNINKTQEENSLSICSDIMKPNDILFGKNECFRTLSLPDFSRVLSLSIQGLRKVKSFTDKSIRDVTSSTSLKKDHPRSVGSVKYTCRQNNNGGGKTESVMVKVGCYMNQKENSVKAGKSVVEWKKYWENVKRRPENVKRIDRECSVEIKGVVKQSKSVFETLNISNTKDNASPYVNNLMSVDNKIADKISFYKKYNGYNRNISGDNYYEVEDPKMRFEKAKHIFESNSLKDSKDEVMSRKDVKLSVPCLRDDLRSGAAPGLLGVPNRLPVVAALTSIYHPDYPHPPVIPPASFRHRGQSPQDLLPWNILLHTDPAYV